MSNKPDVYQIITDTIIAQLEQGKIPWQKPWKSSEEAPRNLVTGKAYRGMNAFMLSLRQDTPYWLTFNQCRAKGGMVRKGEKATPVIFFSFKEMEIDEDTKKKVPFARLFYVFNAAQCDGLTLPKKEEKKGLDFKPIEIADKIVENMKMRPVIKHFGNQACYSPTADVVTMPPKENFVGEEEYYSTIFHELIHATGNVNRLNRKEISEAIIRFGSETYAKEELVAEMGAAFLCGEAGIENKTINNSAAYIRGWLEKLKNDKKFVVQAASLAQKATDWILGKSFEEKEKEEEKA